MATGTARARVPGTQRAPRPSPRRPRGVRPSTSGSFMRNGHLAVQLRHLCGDILTSRRSRGYAARQTQGKSSLCRTLSGAQKAIWITEEPQDRRELRHDVSETDWGQGLTIGLAELVLRAGMNSAACDSEIVSEPSNARLLDHPSLVGRVVVQGHPLHLKANPVGIPIAYHGSHRDISELHRG